ncbi:MAG TPA: hypothetical protein IAB15_01575 [Candidatus Ornithoclostridium faecigallinarum]|nr:hypothetical protein [Candidatus Ornithoclostridium faecigallinarum]
MSKKTDLNNIDTKFDPKRVSKAGPENDLLLDYESERVVAGKGGLENTVGYNLPPKQQEIRYGKKVDPQRRVHRYHGPGVGLLVCVMLLLVVIACVGCGSALWAWDNYAYPYVNLSLPEAFSLASEMYEVDPDKVVTNPYDPEADLDSFYASFKEGMYLSADCDITIADIVNAVMPSEGEGEESRVGDDVNAENPDTGSDPLNALLERLEFDFDRLDKQTNEDLEKEVLEIGDKELAAVLNEAMQTAFEIDQLAEISQQYAIDFPNLIKVEQVVIDGVESVARQDDTRVLATVSVNIGDNIEGIARNAYDNILRPQIAESKPDLAGTLDGMSGTIISVLKKILPKMLYLTVAVYPNDTDRAAYVTYNNVEDEGKQELIDKLFRGQYLQMSDVDVNLNGVLDPEENGVSMSIPQIAGGIVANTIASLNETIMLNFTNTEDSNGVFQTKPIEFMLSILGADNISQGQFLAIMRDVQVPYDRMAEEYPDVDEGDAYSDVTLAANLDKFIDGKDANGNIIETTLTNKYYFNNIKDGERVLKADTLFESIENLMSEEMIAQITIKNENWKDSGDYVDPDAFKPSADYNAIPGLINGYLGTQTEGGIAGMPAKVLKAAYLDNGTQEGAITLTIKADLLALVEESLGGEEEGESDPMADLVTQLLPKAIYLNVNYSLDGASDVTITINDVDEEYGDGQSAADFETIFNLLALFGVNLEMETENGVIVIDNYDEICEMVGDTIASAFDELGVRLGGTLEFTKDNVLFPNIFQVISANETFGYSNYEAQQGISQDEFEKEYAIDDKELYTILKAMYGYEAAGDGEGLGTDITGVTEELSEKYYVNLESTEAQPLLGELKTLKDDLTKLRVSGSEEGLTYMVQDETRLEQLNPQFDAKDIAALIKGSGKLDMKDISILTETVITSSTIENVGGKDRIVFEVTGDVNADASENAKKYAPLFPEKMSVIVTITEEVTNTGADEAKELATTYNLNGIEDDLMKKTMFFIARLSDNKEMTQESIAEKIKTEIDDAFSSLTSEGTIDLDIDGEDVNNEGGHVVLSNVFELATAVIWEEEDGTISEDRPSDVLFRSTIKELWAGLDGYNQANGEDIMKLGYTSAIAPFKVSATTSADTRISDAFIGSQMASEENMKQIIDALGITKDYAVSMYQTYILPGSSATPASPETGYSEAERYDEIKEYFDSTGLISGSGDMLFTLRLGKDALNGVKNSEGKLMSISEGMQHFVPNDLFVSAGITISEEGLNDVRIVINRLDANEQRVLQDMLKRFGVDIAGLFGGEDKTLANQIAATPIVKLTNEDVGVQVLPEEGITVTVGNLFEYAGGTSNGTRFVSGITADLDGQDNSYESSYIYWDYIGNYDKADSSKFESGLPEVYNVGLGYLYYSIDFSGYVNGN